MQSQWIATFAWSKNRRIINMLALLLDDYLKEEACMKYINAKNLLPDALVKELQSYCVYADGLAGQGECKLAAL